MAPVDRRLPRMFPPGSSPIERLRDRLGGPNVGEVGPVGADRLIDRPTQGRAPLSRAADILAGLRNIALGKIVGLFHGAFPGVSVLGVPSRYPRRSYFRAQTCAAMTTFVPLAIMFCRLG